MCIICNCDDHGDAFLVAFERTRASMLEAKTAMLKCAEASSEPDARARYDAAHKKIARLLRDWNSIEHERERGAGEVHAAP